MTLTSQRENCSRETDGRCVLDLGKLAMLEELIGKDESAVAIRKFKTDFELRMSAIAADTTAIAEKAAHAHILVGTAGVFGFRELTMECRCFENAVKHNAAELEPFLTALMSAANRARAALTLLPRG